jgi:excisionase family DNA binding protein
MSIPKVVSVDEAASILRVSPETIQRKIADGSITPFKFGKQVRILAANIDEISAAAALPEPGLEHKPVDQ